jgi:hypothetical protein
VSGLAAARQVADAVLYEGYLLYPYSGAAPKNRLRWQFGVLGPPGALERGDGEPPEMSADLLLRAPRDAVLTVYLRALHLRVRTVEARRDGGFVPVPELRVDGRTWTPFDEAAEVEVPVTLRVADLLDGSVTPVRLPGGAREEPLPDPDGRLVRRWSPVSAEVRLSAREESGVLRVSVAVSNATTGVPPGREEAIRASLLGAHLLLAVDGGEFVSLLEPPEELADVAAGCRRDRCFPVLAGPEGAADLLLVSPIILYDHPAVAPESPGALYDATEIDEILTLRVLTMTDEEKAAARATDPRAAAVVDGCEALTAADLARLHGVLRDPHAPLLPQPEDDEDPRPWWDPAVDGAVDPAVAVVLVDGVPVTRGSTVLLRPRRRADAQDLFYAGRAARVAAVQSDVDGGTHVAVVLADDPAADLHEAYGRYLYFAPDELEPVLPGRAAGAEEDACAPSE